MLDRAGLLDGKWRRVSSLEPRQSGETLVRNQQPSQEYDNKDVGSTHAGRRTCVVITAFAPVPSMAGSHMRVASTIVALDQEFDVHVICTDARPELVDLSSAFCRDHGITYRHDPKAFGLGRGVSLPSVMRFALGCISPRLESMSVRRLPAHLLQLLQSADLIWVYRQSTFRFRSLPSDLEGRVVVDVDDIEERVIAPRTDFPRWFRSLLIRKTRFSRQRLLNTAHTALACSELDAHRLEAACTKRVLPNTYRAGDVTPPTHSAHPHHVVMIGMMNYFPNRDGMQWFVDTIWDRVRQQVPDARLTIAGRGSDELFAPNPERNIEVTGRFDDPASVLTRASTVVVPLRHGSGTRVKILEAFAYGRPVVSTTIGAEGLDVVNGESILIADDPAEFADHVVSLFEDRERASSLAKAGQELFLAKYSPQVFSATVMNIAREVTRTSTSGETLSDNNWNHESSPLGSHSR